MEYQKWLMILKLARTCHEPMKSLHTEIETQESHIIKEIYMWIIKIRWKKTEDQTFVHGRYTLH